MRRPKTILCICGITSMTWLTSTLLHTQTVSPFNFTLWLKLQVRLMIAFSVDLENLWKVVWGGRFFPAPYPVVHTSRIFYGLGPTNIIDANSIKFCSLS